MPLPDERPRQSVANLIGRFELQTKRQSIGSAPPGVPSRTSSAASQIAGDAAKVEAKEQREWPPRPKSIPAVSATDVLDKAQQENTVTSHPALVSEPLPEAIAPASGAPAADLIPSPPETAVPVPKPAPTRQSSMGTTAPRTPATPSKSRSSAPATRTPARPTAKSPPTSFHGAASTSHPPKAPASSTSQSTPIRPRPSSHTSHTSSTVTPARAKTPSLRPKTPVRPKTPSAATTPSRPKTPGSGLFAPTAASLAKARNAAPPVPVPVRKQTTGPGVMERLSKPTAASLSKARAPVQAPSSPARGATTNAATRGAARGTASVSRGTARGGTVSARGTSAKARGASATAARTKASPPAPAATSEFGMIQAEVEHIEEVEAPTSPVEASDLVHEQEGSETTLIDEPQQVSVGLTHDAGLHDTTAETSEAILNTKQEDLEHLEDEEVHKPDEEPVKPDHVEAHEEVTELPPADEPEHAEEAAHEGTSPVESSPEPESEDAHHNEEDVPQSEPEADAESEPEHGHELELESEHENHHTTGDDLADIVNMLEATPSGRPLSIATIPDEFGDDEY